MDTDTGNNYIDGYLCHTFKLIEVFYQNSDFFKKRWLQLAELFYNAIINIIILVLLLVKLFLNY